MRSAAFQLDPRLQVDSIAISQLALCELRLMDDARCPWLLLIPQQHGLTELTDLDKRQQYLLWQELQRVSTALQAIVPCDKLNIGMLGNVVRQLHIHVVARVIGDNAWPGPVWGHGQAQPYETTIRQTRVEALQHLLA